MQHTGFTRASLRAVAILVVLLAAVLLGPAPIKAMNDMHDVYTFMPTGVTDGREVRLDYHNFTKGPVKVRFLLLNANGQDLFVVNKINATFVIGPGMMATAVVPCNGVLGPNQTRAEVTGMVAFFPPPGAPDFKPKSFVGPASLQLVDEITQQTLLAVGIVTPSDLVGVIGPLELAGAIGPID